MAAPKKAAAKAVVLHENFSEYKPSPAHSSDPAVHQLLAHRQSAELNNDEAAMAAVDAQLADLGY